MNAKRSDASECSKALEASFKENDKIAVFVDGYSTSLACSLLGLRIDWQKVAELFRYLSRVTTINFYISTSVNNTVKTDMKMEMKPLSDWLSHNGYKVLSERGFHFTYVENPNSEDQFDKKGYKTGYDIQLAVDALLHSEKIDKLVLFSGNSDYCPMVQALQSKGVSVIVITNSLGHLRKLRDEKKITNTGTVGVQLIRCANEFFELEKLRPEIEHTEQSDTIS